MYKLIACDIDETLLNDDRVITPYTKEMVMKAQQKGVKFVLATGRGFMMVQDYLKELALYDKPNEYVISFNGGCITENKDNKEVKFDGITFELAQELFNLGEKYEGIGIHLYTDKELFMYRMNPEDIHLSKIDGSSLIDSNDISFAKEMNIAKVLFESLDMERLYAIHDDIKPIIGEQVSMSYSSHRYLEINQKGIDKGTVLLALADMLGIKHEETMAIGDNSNDASMIKAAGLGVAVGNAIPEIKAIARHISKKTNNEDAVGHIINELILTK